MQSEPILATLNADQVNRIHRSALRDAPKALEQADRLLESALLASFVISIEILNPGRLLFGRDLDSNDTNEDLLWVLLGANL